MSHSVFTYNSTSTVVVNTMAQAQCVPFDINYVKFGFAYFGILVSPYTANPQVIGKRVLTTSWIVVPPY